MGAIQDSIFAGRVIAVRGSVIDVRFAAGSLPPIGEALEIARGPDACSPLVVEVQLHVDGTTARAVALGDTAGLRRGTPVRPTGAPVSVPVGDRSEEHTLNSSHAS